jgi:hypothetical protein
LAKIAEGYLNQPMRKFRNSNNLSGGETPQIIQVFKVSIIVLLTLNAGGLIAYLALSGNKGDHPRNGDANPFASLPEFKINPQTFDTKINLEKALSQIPQSKNQTLSKASLQILRPGMTLDEVEVLLGAGKQANKEDIKIAFGNGSIKGGADGPPEDQWMNNAQKSGVTAWYQWRENDSSIFVGFAIGKRSGKLKALLSFWVERFSVSGGLYGFRTDAGFLTFGDPDQITDARDAENRKINDPKWKKGAARQLLLGRWQDSIRRICEFKSDGTLKGYAQGNSICTFRFIDEDHIEISIPETQMQPGRILRHRVLINKEELLLVWEMGNQNVLSEYKRAK